MVMVVMLLFAVAVAGLTGYQLVAAEADLASSSEESAIALAAARAGLERYVGEHIGTPGDTVAYLIDDATVSVRQRRLLEVDDDTDLYQLEAVGEMADPRFPGSPARRTVRQYASFHKMPVRPKAALMAPNNDIWVRDGTSTWPSRVIGADASSVGQCVNGGGAGVLGIAGSYAPTIDPGDTELDGGSEDVGDVAALIDTAQVRWSVLEDPDFPIPFYDGIWPDFLSLPPDSFPVVRVNGNLSASFFRSGRGALIVTGTISFSLGFNWDGIILAGSATDLAGSSFWGADVDGMVVTGLDGGSPGQVTVRYTTIEYHECNVRDSNLSLGYFELESDSRWEF